MVHAYNPSTKKAKAERLRVWEYPGLQNKTISLKTKNKPVKRWVLLSHIGEFWGLKQDSVKFIDLSFTHSLKKHLRIGHVPVSLPHTRYRNESPGSAPSGGRDKKSWWETLWTWWVHVSKWLTTAIPATQEQRLTGRIMNWGQPGQKGSETSFCLTSQVS
jgi:hypothetical protein